MRVSWVTSQMATRQQGQGAKENGPQGPVQMEAVKDQLFCKAAMRSSMGGWVENN